MTAVRATVKSRAGKSWDRVRSAAERLERIQPGAGEALLVGAAETLDDYLRQRLSAVPGFPQDRKAS